MPICESQRTVGFDARPSEYPSGRRGRYRPEGTIWIARYAPCWEEATMRRVTLRLPSDAEIWEGEITVMCDHCWTTGEGSSELFRPIAEPIDWSDPTQLLVVDCRAVLADFLTAIERMDTRGPGRRTDRCRARSTAAQR